MSRKRLQEINKWNRPAFMPKENLFFNAGQMQIGGTNPFGVQQLTQPASNYNWGSAVDRGRAIADLNTMGNNFSYNANQIIGSMGTNQSPELRNLDFGTSRDIANKTQSGASSLEGKMGDLGKAALNAVASIAGDVAGNVISNGYSSKAGDIVGSVGRTVLSTAGSIIGGPIGGAIGNFVGGALGGVTNALWGEKEDVKKHQQADASINQNSNYKSDAADYEGIHDVASATDTHIWDGGIFNSSADEKNAEYAEKMDWAHSWAQRGYDNNVYNIGRNQVNNALAEYSAFGGPIDRSGMGAINYDFMDRYLTSKENQAQNKNISNSPNILNAAKTFGFGGFVPNPFELYGGFASKDEFDHWQTEQAKKEEPYAGVTGNVPSDANGSSFIWALGGDMQTNSTDWSTGLMHINAGGSHESSPYDGVQIGTDSEGTPNLVEEGETVYQDYVYSNRILADEETKKKFHLPKKKDITYADISKKLEKEIAERPNDPISEAGFNAQMEQLANEQERQKAEMEAERAREAFEALSPEEQTAIMQKAAQEEAMAQQVAQEQAMSEQQAEGLYSPEEIAMMQQQQMQADGSQANLGMEPQIQACGGKINKFEKGGLKKRIYKETKSYTDADFKKWFEKNLAGKADYDAVLALLNDDNYDRLKTNKEFWKAVTKNNSALAHAIEKGEYDFGTFKPSESTGEINFNDSEGNSYMNVGNWAGANDKEHPSATWNGSGDRMYKEAVDILKKRHGKDWENKWNNLTRTDLENLFKETQAYKDTTDWLMKSSDNMREYLRALNRDPNFNTESAKRHLEKFLDTKIGDWKEGVDTSDIADLYSQIFGEKSGNAGRMYYPGNYWHTPSILNNPRGNNTINYVKDADGNWQEIVTEIPSDWKLDNTYSWQKPDTDLTYNYYITPEEKAKAAEIAAATEKPAEEEQQRGVRPVYKDERLRKLGLLGPAVGISMMAAGIGKPEYSGLMAAVNGAGIPHLASAKYLGDYEKYIPLDIWYEQNALNAQARAADRTIMNSSLPTTSKYAALLANGLNSQIASGNLFRQAQEYNDAKYHRTKEFNRGTNQYNADAFNRLSQFNADVLNRAGQHKSGMAMQAAAQKLNADANWYNSLYGNVSGIFKGLSDLGRENAQRNQVADMAAAGIFGVMNPDRFNPNSILRWETDDEMQKRLNKQKKITAKGGKIKRKKGLTF